MDQYHNFVFATDQIERKLAIFMIDEKDLENDDETLKVWETDQIKGKIVKMQYCPKSNYLITVSSDPF